MSHAPTGTSIQNILHIKQVTAFSWKVSPSLSQFMPKVILHSYNGLVSGSLETVSVFVLVASSNTDLPRLEEKECYGREQV